MAHIQMHVSAYVYVSAYAYVYVHAYACISTSMWGGGRTVAGIEVKVVESDVVSAHNLASTCLNELVDWLQQASHGHILKRLESGLNWPICSKLTRQRQGWDWKVVGMYVYLCMYIYKYTGRGGRTVAGIQVKVVKCDVVPWFSVEGLGLGCRV